MKAATDRTRNEPVQRMSADRCLRITAIQPYVLWVLDAFVGMKTA